MRYAKIMARSVLVRDTPFPGSKPLVVVMPDPEHGMVAVPNSWEETDTEIRQLWRLEPSPEPEATIEDYEREIQRFGVIS